MSGGQRATWNLLSMDENNYIDILDSSLLRLLRHRLICILLYIFLLHVFWTVTFLRLLLVLSRITLGGC